MHKPVLLNEAVEALHIKNQAWYIDATLGAGGHTLAIMESGGNVLGIEADKYMLEIAKKRIEEACPTPEIFRERFRLVNANFRDLKTIVQKENLGHIQGILFDLGISTMHYSDIARGFSFSKPDEPLDMRLNLDTQSVTAADLVNALREDQLINLFIDAIDWKDARFFTRLIIAAREKRRIETVGDLLTVLPNKRIGKTHPGTKVFMALRMGVNTELENIELGINQALNVLDPGGILAVITFHSTEDRLVKNLLKAYDQTLIIPSQQEIEENPSARSAKLRVVIKQ